MKISSYEEMENLKIKNKNSFHEINNSLPNSKVDLIIEKNIKLGNEDLLNKIGQKNHEDNSSVSNEDKNIDICVNLNSKINRLEHVESSENENSNTKKDNSNTNIVETKKNYSHDSHEKSKRDIYDYDFLSLSEIDFDREKDFRFFGYMIKKKLDLESDNDFDSIYNYDTGNENVFYVQNGRRIKIRLFLESNKITAFNQMTDFKLKNAKYFPIVNLDLDFLTVKIYLDVESCTFKIFTLGSNEYFSFFIPNKSAFEKIANKVNLLIHNSKGYKTNLFTIALRKEFYKVFLFKIK